MSDRSGIVYLDDVRLSNENLDDVNHFKVCSSSDDGPFKLCLPLDNYDPYDVPVSAVMDHSLNLKGVITTYNGEEGRIENGCKKYISTNNYANCFPPISNHNPPVDILGYAKTGGGSFTFDFNFQDPNGRTYAFYDEHTGYDFVPAGVENLDVPVYAAESGTVSYGVATYNEVIITHRDDYTTHYLHMLHDEHLVASGTYVRKGERIGTAGNVGPVSPHLHLTVKRNGQRIDPYTLRLWE